MKMVKIILFLFCMSNVYSMDNGYSFAKSQISKQFGTQWKNKKLVNCVNRSKRKYSVIQKHNDTNSYFVKFTARRNYVNSSSIIAVLEKDNDMCSRADGTDLLIIEWYIDSKTNSVKKMYEGMISNIGSNGTCSPEFKYEQINDTSSILFMQDDYLGQGLVSFIGYFIYKCKNVLELENYKQYTFGFTYKYVADVQDDANDENEIKSEIEIDDNLITITTIDYTQYTDAGWNFHHRTTYELKDDNLLLCDFQDLNQ